ncbi:hypothetical protein BD626DRAFT_222254 [Schizophyllum amplum]|uniref:Uncharacterized protein n=1 Tax=Schizophyllum amplum TaxID=97359 RepID=A0A550BXG9_9AGAR|nr:hypothetical protein BD626DRAFT_222254 [Auriculariopsis ampla]
MISGRCIMLSCIWISGMLVVTASAALVDPLPQSWFFDFYDPDDASSPLLFPVARQCDTLSIRWSSEGASGPTPSPPYTFTVFSSAYYYPITLPAGDGDNLDWLVTFPPQSQFQLCMFDSAGNTGGCQRIYSVAAPTNSCDNSTLPDPPAILSVEATSDDGTLSSDGDGPAECTDVIFTPRNGTAPYNLTILPPSHPPYNITIDDGDTLKWTVTLSESNVFWAAVTDSEGAQWAFPGPITVSEGADKLCLSGRSSRPTGISPGAAAGSGVGGLAAGLIVGALAAWFAFGKRYTGSGRGNLGNGENSPTDYRVVPFADPDASLGGRSTSYGGQTSYGGRPISFADGLVASFPAHKTGSLPPDAQRKSVYVVHGPGGAPVTVYHGDDTHVVELPPGYEGYEMGSGSSRGTWGGAASPSGERLLGVGSASGGATSASGEAGPAGQGAASANDRAMSPSSATSGSLPRLRPNRRSSIEKQRGRSSSGLNLRTQISLRTQADASVERATESSALLGEPGRKSAEHRRESGERQRRRESGERRVELGERRMESKERRSRSHVREVSLPFGLKQHTPLLGPQDPSPLLSPSDLPLENDRPPRREQRTLSPLRRSPSPPVLRLTTSDLWREQDDKRHEEDGMLHKDADQRYEDGIQRQANEAPALSPLSPMSPVRFPFGPTIERSTSLPEPSTSRSPALLPSALPPPPSSPPPVLPTPSLLAPAPSSTPSSPAIWPKSAFSEYSSSESHLGADDKPRGWRASILDTFGATLGRGATGKELKEPTSPTRSPDKKLSRGSIGKSKEREETRGRLPTFDMHLSLGRSTSPKSAHIEPFTLPPTRTGHYAPSRQGSGSPTRWQAPASPSRSRVGSASPPRMSSMSPARREARTPQPRTPSPPARLVTPSPSRLQPSRPPHLDASPRGPRPLQPLRRVSSAQDPL